MGVVYEADQVQLARSVALKVLDARPGQVSTHNIDQRFLREASLLSKLSHSNTVRVFDYGVEDGRPFLVMELVRGPTLRQLIGRGPLPPLRAMRIAHQVCGSLHEAHRAGVIHRDLKPANVLIAHDQDGEDMVKVVDFGLVKEMHTNDTEMTADGLILGTPQFMAPEQIRAQPLDQRCDIYAMGVLIFKSITGQYPHEPGDPTMVLMAHLKAMPRTLDEVTPGLGLPGTVQWTIDRCLAKNREDRFLDARELQRALRLCEAALLDEQTATLARPVLIDGRVDLPEQEPLSSVGAGGSCRLRDECDPRACRHNVLWTRGRVPAGDPVWNRLVAGDSVVIMFMFLATLSAGWAQDPAPDAFTPEEQEARVAQARELYRLGAGLYKAGRYKEAIGAFSEAYDLSGNQKLLYNIANAQERLGDLTGAIESLKGYRPHAPSADRVSLDLRIAALEDRIASVPPAPTPIPTQEPPPPTSALDMVEAPVQAYVRRPRWALVGTGVAVAVGFGAVTTWSYLRGLDQRTAGDEEGYGTTQIINNIAIPVAGAGGVLAIAGFVFPTKRPVSVSASPSAFPAGTTVSLRF